MPAVYSAIDVLVMSSCDGEGFPNAVAEAMSCRTPCVVTAVGAAPEIVGNTGAVAPPCNPELLCSRLVEVITGNSRATLARERIQNKYSIDRLADATEAAMQEAVGLARHTMDKV